MKSWLAQGSSGRQAVADPREGPGGPGPLLFLDQTEARRAENFLRPPPSPCPLSEGLDLPLASHPSTRDKFSLYKWVRRYTRKLSTYLDSINRPVML